MTELTKEERLGGNMVFDESTKKLTLDLNDFSSILINGKDYGLDVASITATNFDSYAARIIWSILLFNQSNQPEDNIDETVGLFITNEGKRNVIRNSVAQVGFRLVATGYKNDTDGVILDPDSIGA